MLCSLILCVLSGEDNSKESTVYVDLSVFLSYTRFGTKSIKHLFFYIIVVSVCLISRDSSFAAATYAAYPTEDYRVS